MEKGLAQSGAVYHPVFDTRHLCGSPYTIQTESVFSLHSAHPVLFRNVSAITRTGIGVRHRIHTPVHG